MKGVMFNLLEEVVTTQMGEDAWDRILDGAGIEGVYTSLGNYPDEELRRLLAVLSRQTGHSERDSLRWYGRLSMPFLVQRYPDFFEAHRSLRSLLLALNDVIHAEVRKLYPGADVPDFQFETPPGVAGHDTLVIHYRSKRRLCPLAEGFIAGASDYFRERVAVTQSQCMLEGAKECTLVCRFEGRTAE